MPDLAQSLPLAITRENLADFAGALILVYIILVFANVLISYVPRMPYDPRLRAVLDFVTETTNPYLNLFRGIVPRVGVFDLGPMVGIILLWIAYGVVPSLIAG